jgi:pimeloyl-ACP methyl ester carboxylesterase
MRDMPFARRSAYRYLHAPVRLTRRLASAALAATVLTLVAGAASAGAQSAPRLRTCPGQGSFSCGTLTVPLDWNSRVPGTIGIRFATQRNAPRSRKLLIALSGGPGQPSVEAATSFSLSLEPALSRYRLAVLDQRGTGGSGVLRCPNVQALRDLDPFRPGALAGCASRIGPRRVFFSTADTVLDIDALRKRLGADKVALMGISYGTHVALQYARAFPQNVDRLILDSIVGPDGPDPFLLDTYRNLPRVLREQCRGTRCRNVTNDPVADLAALVSRINSRGALRGSFFDDRGVRRRTRYAQPDELMFLLIAGDLNPLLQAALPGALSAARRGDTALLMRLRRIGQGAGTRTEDLSFGLNVTTGCLDVPRPYPLATPGAARPAIAQAALAAIPPAQYAPFDAQTVLRTGYVDDCLLWPQDAPRPPFAGPLPDVPALLLGGRLDLRTPVENAIATAAQLPHASVVTLPGSGHDATDSDLTGCIARALTRFVADRTVGNPCRGRDNGLNPIPAPPNSLDDFRSAPGVGGVRGRALFAVLDSVQDALITAGQLQGSGLPLRGGGLRGGRFTFSDDSGNLRLRRYRVIGGLRVTGTVRIDEASALGRLSVQGPRGASGFVQLTRTGATGRLGGRNVRFRAPGAASAAAASAAWRAGARGVALPAVPAQLRRAPLRTAGR